MMCACCGIKQVAPDRITCPACQGWEERAFDHATVGHVYWCERCNGRVTAR